MGAVRTFVSLIGFVSSMTVAASPLPLIAKVYKDKSLKDLHIATFVSMLLNNAVSLLYSYHAGIAPMVLQRALASVLSVFYVAVFVVYSSKYRENMLWISVFFITMTLLLFDVNIPRDPGLSTEPESVDHVGRDLGIAFALTSAFFNASPLLSLKEACEKSNPSVFPSYLCFSNWISCIAWLALGIMERSQAMILSQAWGTLVTSIQVFTIVYLNYILKSRHRKNASTLP